VNKILKSKLLFKAPILIIAFNRPHTTEIVFEAIRKVRPSKLYFACDGPRLDREGEVERVKRVHQLIDKVDWDCDLKTLFRIENFGCKYAVSSAINWFFENEERGIILEDDCVPNIDFFYFCDDLLERYKDNSRVMAVTGNNFQCGHRHGDGSYYFSKYMHIWGWASWRRAWKHYDVEMNFWSRWKNSKGWSELFDDSVEQKYWRQVFDRVTSGLIDTWDYQLIASIWFQNGLVATPNVNLVTNIGFGPDATHTTSTSNFLANTPVYILEELSHPPEIKVNKFADRHIFNYVFEGRSLRFPMIIIIFPRRLLGRFYRALKRKFT
jgi:hypothetical protein